MHHRTVTILVLITITATAASVILNPDILGIGLSIVVTGSMDGQPAGYPIRSIPIGSLIAVDTSASDIRIGDVVGYHSPLMDGPVYHRITSISGDEIIVKGDNLDLEETIHSNDIVGKVFFVSEPLGHIISRIKDNIIPILLIVLGVYLLFTETPSPNKGQEREEK